MDKDIESLLRISNIEKPKNVLFLRTPNEEKVIQIMQDIKNEKIIFKPTNDAHIQICNMFRELLPRYERFKDTRPFPSYLTRRIIQTYNDAKLYGLIPKDQDEEIEKLHKVIDTKNKENAELRKKLARHEGDDKPNDSVQSEVQEEDD